MTDPTPALPAGADDDGARLLAAGPSAGAAAHLAVFGTRPTIDPAAFARELELSGLNGRGGAGFPAFLKLAATAGRRGAIVIGNGSEGEPWSGKDAVLLAHAPHLVLDGLLTAADAVRARRAILYLHRASIPAVSRAIAERTDAHRVELVEAAESFIAGEASAVVNAIQTGAARPRDRVRRLSESGLDGRPTLVHNVETLAQLALVARYGGAWFRSVGSPGDPGTRLLTISGDVAAPGIVEVATDTTIAEVVARSGGDLASTAAVLVGGYHGSWLKPKELALALDLPALAAVGAHPGAGVVHVLGSHRCGLAVTADIVAELASASADQCGPCRFGLPAMAARFGDLAAGRMAPAAAAELARLAESVDGRGACHHPDGTARLTRSALRVFSQDIHAHAQGRCVRVAAGGGRR